MSRIYIWSILICTLPAVCKAQTCPDAPVDTEHAAIAFLQAHEPKQNDKTSQVCIIEAIDVLSQLRSQAAVPQLVRYLQYQRPEGPGESSGFLLRPPIEGDRYPAVLALARVGASARGPLLRTIEEGTSSNLELQNAAHAIILSFLLGKEQDPAEGVAFLTAAVANTGKPSEKRLQKAIEYAVASPACRRVSPNCERAAKPLHGGSGSVRSKFGPVETRPISPP